MDEMPETSGPLPVDNRELATVGSDERPIVVAENRPGDEFEPCILCGGRDFEAVFPRRLPWVSRCVGCGFLCTNPQPSDAELAAIYDAQYYQTFGYRLSGESSYRTMKQVWFNELLGIAERNFRVGRLLDVGSALGDMLLAAQRRGWEAEGVEPNPFAVEQAQRVAPGATRCCGIEDFHAPAGSFDLIACSDVLEHLRRPDQFLRKIHDLLRPGGGLALTTIDVQSPSARILGSRWVHFHRDHLWYFSRHNLAQVVQAAGLELVCCQAARKVFNLNYLLEILSHTPNWATIRHMSRLGLACLPQIALGRLFSIQEGLLVVARRPISN